MKKIHFVRHGRTSGNEIGLWQTFDQTLSDFGREQAKKVSKKLKNIKADTIITSDMDRALETATIINMEIGLEVIPTKLLHEIHRPSVVRGKLKTDPDTVLVMDEVKKHWVDGSWKHSDEENFFDLKNRVESALRHITDLPGEVVVAVTHEFVLRMIFAVTLFGEKLTPELFGSIVKFLLVENTGVSTFIYDKGSWKLLSWNDHSHLSDPSII